MGKILRHAIWIVIVFASYGIAFYIPLPSQFESRGILFTDEILLIASAFLIYFSFGQKHWGWKYFSLLLTLLGFVLPLLRLWETAESTWNIVLGLLPWADAGGYYVDASNLINGELMSTFSGRRPMFASFLAVLLKISGQNLQFVLIIFVALVGVAVFLFALEIQREFGSAAATVAIYLSHFFYRPYIGTTLTEQLGFPAGLLAFAVLLRGVSYSDRRLFSTGLVFLTFSLFVRAGAFFILALLFVFGVRFFVKRGYSTPQVARIFVISVSIPIALNIWLGRMVASPDTVPFGNFSYTLYGQAVGGKGWTQVLMDHPELNSLKEPELSREINQLAFEAMAKNPLGLVRGTAKAWRDFIVPGYGSVFSFLEVGNRPIDLILQIAVSLMFLAGIWLIWQDRQMPVYGFLLASGLGIFISIPFLPPNDAGIRPYAATTAVIFLPVIVAVSRLSSRWMSGLPVNDIQTSRILASYGMCLIFTAALGGYLFKITAQPTIIQAVNCSSRFVPAYIRVMPGSNIQLVESDSIRKTHVPVVLLKDVLRSFDEFPYGDFAGVLRKVKQPALITMTNDLSTGAQLWVIAPAEMADFQGRIISICAELISSQYSVIHVKSFETP